MTRLKQGMLSVLALKNSNGVLVVMTQTGGYTLQHVRFGFQARNQLLGNAKHEVLERVCKTRTARERAMGT
ncbi:hypothetical protein LPJ69_004151 [Coemansia sp. RSA 1752]|nr:hypothetical protein LPJ69_004151 [Coemansia sp. RSA 1752]